ncbi:MAG: DUF3619 family protein [Gammaproteobacteria bacterium]
MKDDTTDANLTRKLARRLDADAESLDPDVVRRLRLARHAALDQLDAPRHQHYGRWLAGAAGVAVVALLAARLATGPTDVPSFEYASAEVMSDLELLTDEEDLELLEELEFFRWLAANDEDLS